MGKRRKEIPGRGKTMSRGLSPAVPVSSEAGSRIRWRSRRGRQGAGCSGLGGEGLHYRDKELEYQPAGQ